MVPAMKPRTVCFCQPVFATISVKVTPFLRRNRVRTCAALLPLRGALTCARGPVVVFLPEPALRLVRLLRVGLWTVPCAGRAGRMGLGVAGADAAAICGSINRAAMR